MSSQINPPEYTWTAETAEEALSVLDSATKLVRAHLATLAPDAGLTMFKVERSARLDLAIRLDLGPLIDQINEARAVPDSPAELG